MIAIGLTSASISLMYLATLIPLGSNIFLYLFKQSRYKVWLTTTFYFLAIWLVVFRFWAYLEFSLATIGSYNKDQMNRGLVLQEIASMFLFFVIIYLSISQFEVVIRLQIAIAIKLKKD